MLCPRAHGRPRGPPKAPARHALKIAGVTIEFNIIFKKKLHSFEQMLTLFLNDVIYRIAYVKKIKQNIGYNEVASFLTQ